MPTDPKWRVIARKSGQPIALVIATYNFLMVNAAANATERGRTHGWNNEDVAAALDVSEQDIAAILDAMQGKVMEGDRLSGWEKRQPKREDSSAERAKRWRNERNRTQPNAQERPDIDADAEIEADKKEELTASAAFAFHGSVIRLKKPQYEKWVLAYHKLDLPAELQSRDDWLSREADEATRKKWFISTSNYLRQRQMQAKANGAKYDDWEQPC